MTSAPKARAGRNARELSPLNDAVARELRAERSRLRMTQETLAEASGIPRSTIISIESGKAVIDVSQIHRLTAALGVPSAVLMERAEALLAAGLSDGISQTEEV